MIIWKCKKCGWTKPLIVNEEFDLQHCILCGDLMYQEKQDRLDEPKVMTYDELIDYVLLDNAMNDIKALGKEKCWDILNKITPLETRISYLEFYLEAFNRVKQQEA